LREVRGFSGFPPAAEGGQGRWARISHNRADAVREYLIRGGIDSDRLTAQGYGDNVPLADPRGDDAEGNLRVELSIVEGTSPRPGCAPDTDGDGRFDAIDRCREHPEDYDGFEDTDGCPEDGEGEVHLNCDRFEGLDAIEFEDGSYDIPESATPILDQVAAILLSIPGLTIEVQGHSGLPPDHGDSPIVDALMFELAENRAQAIRHYLIEAGIEDSSIRALGYGNMMPIADPTTEEGQEINRRIEIVVDRECD